MPKTFLSTSVVAQACEHLLMEDHVMVRRAWIELLVNLLQVQDVFDYFTFAKASTAQPDAATKSDSQVRLTLRLRMLLGPAKSTTGRTSTLQASWHFSDRQDSPLMLKAAKRHSPRGWLALRYSPWSPRTAQLSRLCYRSIRLFPILISTLILDRSEDAERNEWEHADWNQVKRARLE